MEHDINLNIHYTAPKEVWEKIDMVYVSMPYVSYRRYKLMEDKRKIKEIYNCISIASNEELYPLQKWYNQLIEKTIAEITVADVLRMIRQKEFTNLAMSKAINFLQEDVFVGESYEGELFEKVSEMDS